MYKGKTSSYNSYYDERGDGYREVSIDLSDCSSRMGSSNWENPKLVPCSRTAYRLFVSFLLGRDARHSIVHLISSPSNSSFDITVYNACTGCRRY